MGVFSIGVIAGAYVIISHDMSASYAANHPANIELRMADSNDDVLNSVRNMPGIGTAEGRRVFSIRARPVNSSTWTVIDLVAFNDFMTNKVDLLTPLAGNTNPSKRQVVLEKDALKQLNVKVGDQLIFEMPDGTTKSMPVVGAVQDPTTGAGDFLAPPFGYISMTTLENFQEPDLYNRIYATVSQNQDDDAYISKIAGDVKDRLVRAGIPVDRTLTSKTHEHPLASTVNAILGILMALGVLIVFLSVLVDRQYSQCIIKSAFALYRGDEVTRRTQSSNPDYVFGANHFFRCSGFVDRCATGRTRRLRI